jgi:3-hydroxybutyryl-CoA dehydratase
MNAIVSPDRLADIAATTKFTERFAITAEEMEGFAALSGDRNPVHGAADFARKLGFEGRVVYEGLLIARLSRLIATAVPGVSLWGGLRVDFHHPLYVGEPASLTVSVDEGLSTEGVAHLGFRVEARRGDEYRLVADGIVDALLRLA